MRRAHRTFALLALAPILAAVLRGDSGPEAIRPGEIIESVSCRRAPGQSYALYLPTAYTPRRSWPIIYAFDPGAQGAAPVRLYHEIAEKYGYIIAGSNQSQNFDAGSSAAGAQAMLQDTQERFSMDLRRIYTTGFSGGARVATWVALSCSACQVKGVVASGATYPADRSPTQKDGFLYFMALGDTDFNYPEWVEMQATKERLGSPYRARMFPGPHHWAPASVFEEAIAWFQMRGIQSGAIPVDEAFIRQQRQRELDEAGQAAAAHDVLREFFAYRSLVEDFRGLADASDVAPKLRALTDSPELKQALQEQRRETDAQHALTRGLAPDIAHLFENQIAPDSAPELRAAIVSGLQRLKQGGTSAKNERQKRIYLRAFNSVLASIIEEGQRRQARKKFAEALPLFELVTDAAPDRPWPALLLAETRVSLGDKKRALKAIKQAANTGAINAQALVRDPALAPLFSDPEFQNVVEQLRKQQPR